MLSFTNLFTTVKKFPFFVKSTLIVKPSFIFSFVCKTCVLDLNVVKWTIYFCTFYYILIVILLTNPVCMVYNFICETAASLQIKTAFSSTFSLVSFSVVFTLSKQWHNFLPWCCNSHHMFDFINFPLWIH